MGRFHQGRQFVGGHERHVLGIPSTHDDNFVVLRHLFQE
jgi:hypothetical protein